MMIQLKHLSRTQLEAATAAMMQELGEAKAKYLLESVTRGSASTLASSSSQQSETKRQKINDPDERTSGDGERSSSATAVKVVNNNGNKNKSQKGGFSMARYSQRKIALWVAYFGHNYKGLASNGEDDDGTIESELFCAMKKTKLVDESVDREAWEFSRCGRTDAGVSGFSQIVALKLRSSNRPVAPEVSTSSATTTALAWGEATAMRTPPSDEMLDYTAILNRVLPPDIMVLAHSAVRPDFNARFGCSSRTYRYFFTARRPASLEPMRRACEMLKGTHDFRNFCKMDVANVKSFVRTIEEARVVGGEEPGRAGYVEIRGNAFLWHQIRMIMGVLFLVARGLESPDVVRELLHVEKVVRRPTYQMASDAPLVLWEVSYPEGEFEWKTNPTTLHRVGIAIDKRMSDSMVRAEMSRMFLERLTHPPFSLRPEDATRESDQDEACGSAERHVPLLKRPGASTLEELQNKVASRRERKKGDDSEEDDER